MILGLGNTIPSDSVRQGLGGGGGGFNNTYSLAFDGVDDYVDCGDSDNLSFGNGSTDSPFSISAWIKPSSIGTTFHILNKENNTTTGDEYVLYITSANILRFAICDQNFIADRQGRITSALTASEIGNVWCHIVATYDGRGGSTASDGINIYVNGVNRTSGTFNAGSYTAMHNTTSDVKIGSYSSGVFANGNIDETAIFSSELTSENVTSIYNSGTPTTLPVTPVAHWKMGEEANFTDNWLVNNSALSNYSTRSFNFDGVDDKITFSDITTSGDFTVSFWAKPTAFNVNGSSFIFGTESGNSNFFKFVSATRVQMKIVALSGSTNTFTDTTGSNNVVLNEWQNFIATRDSSGNFTMYRNGVQFGITVTNANTLTINSIGRVISSSIGYAGGVDEFAYWDSVQDVASIYNSGTPADLTSLSPISWWRMGEDATFSTNWSLPDNGSASNTGTSANMTIADLEGDAPNYTGGGLSANMTIEDRVGDAPNSTSNALSYNMTESDRETDVPT